MEAEDWHEWEGSLDEREIQGEDIENLLMPCEMNVRSMFRQILGSDAREAFAHIMVTGHLDGGNADDHVTYNFLVPQNEIERLCKGLMEVANETTD